MQLNEQTTFGSKYDAHPNIYDMISALLTINIIYNVSTTGIDWPPIPCVGLCVCVSVCLCVWNMYYGEMAY